MSLNLSHADKLYIGGEWQPPASADLITIVSPSDESIVGKVARAVQADVDRAVATARQAFDTGAWPRMSGSERAEKLRSIAGHMRERSDEFARAWSLQVGLPYTQSAAISGYFPAYFDYYADLAERGFEEVRTTAAGKPCVVAREPVGVAVAVVPWNAPLATLMLKVAPALAAGCTLIVKPSEETPLEALLLAECVDAAGLPPGVFSVLPADREVSDYLIRKEEVDKVSFTGSTAAGLHVASVCAERSARFTTELGGKSAAIILDDARLDTVLGEVMPTVIGMAGQQCAAFSRILVPRHRQDEFVGAFEAAFKSVKVGRAFDPEAQMGPIVTSRQRERVCGYIQQGETEGARLVTGSRDRPANLDSGWFVEPTLFADVTNDMAIAREEIFGPVGVIIAYDSVEDAIRIANDSPYGLSGGVFTEDAELAYTVMRRIRTGNIGHNGRVIDFTVPYGGFKRSGVGREGGPEGLEAFTEVKAIFMDRLPAHLATTTD